MSPICSHIRWSDNNVQQLSDENESQIVFCKAICREGKESAGKTSWDTTFFEYENK